METKTTTVAEAARWVGCHQETIRRAIRTKSLPAVTRGDSPKSGYVLLFDDVLDFARSRGNAASFRESAPLFGDEGTFPTPSLPPLGGTTADLIAYGERLTALAKAALGEARRRIERGNNGET